MFEQHDLRRYHVRHADGRPGMMDVATASSPAAMSLMQFAQTLPPGYLLDQGMDAQGNPFVVAHHAAFAPPPPAVMPMAPPPPPRQPMAKGTRNLLIGLAVVGFVGAGALIVWSNREKPKPKLKMNVRGEWSTACKPKYTVIVEARKNAKVKVLDKKETIDYEGEVRIQLTQDELGDKKELVIEADHKKGFGKETLTIEPPPDDFPPIKLVDSYSYNAPTVTVSVGGATPTAPETDYGYDDSYDSDMPSAGAAVAPVAPPYDPTNDRNDLRAVTLKTCKVKAVSRDEGGVKVESAGNQTTITVDVGEQLIRAPGEPPTMLDVPVKLEKEDGTPIVVNLSVDTSNVYGTIAAYERLKNVAAMPIPEAPYASETPSPKPILIVRDTVIERDLLGQAAPLSAPLIAVVSTSDHDSGSCGPYSEYAYYGGYGGQYATRYRVDADIKLYEARTGALVAKTYIKGKKPSCPSSVTTYNGVVGSISGDPPSTAITKWLKKQQ